MAQKTESKGDKEWQPQLEAMEKRMMECIDKLDKTIVENTQELYGKMVRDLENPMKN